MTTNITPIKALKKIKEYWDKLASDKKYAELIDKILIQALAPQEYDVDVTKCEFYRHWFYVDDNPAYDNLLNKYPEEQCTLQNCITKDNECYIDVPFVRSKVCTLHDCKCSDNPNCYFKKWQRVEQLHSQQKTFMVEEIRNKIQARLDLLNIMRLDKLSNPILVKCLELSIDELECLLVEFEKE